MGRGIDRGTGGSAHTHKMANRPEKIFMVGAARATIFRNEVTKDGKTYEMPKVVLEIRYKTRDGRWAGTSAMSLHEIQKAILALQQAYEYLTTSASWANLAS